MYNNITKLTLTTCWE